MRVSADRSSPDYFHGRAGYESWLDRNRLDGCAFIDTEAGVARIKEEEEVKELRGFAEVCPRRRRVVVR